MVTTPDYINYFNDHSINTPKGLFRISNPIKKSKTIEFFETLYSYPPKFRVKWEALDDLNETTSFLTKKDRASNLDGEFTDAVSHFFATNMSEPSSESKFPKSIYVDSYLNKLASTSFYKKESKKLENCLNTVPIYVILNGQNEIVVANSTDFNSSSHPTITKTLYNFSEVYDPLAEKKEGLGLFFMSKDDAIAYLNEIAMLDMSGTKSFGLSINCVGLDFAYRIMRDSNVDVDFRFVPNLKEINALLTKESIENSNLIFSDEQHQIRVRNRVINPIMGGFKKTEYFKGVPIYLIRVQEIPTKFLTEQYFNSINFIDKAIGTLFQGIKLCLGCGNSKILQGSIKKQDLIAPQKTYIFFEKESALNFCKKHSREVVRYQRGYSPIFDSFARQPKIFVYNLEDFLEIFEESSLEKKEISDTKNVIDMNNFILVPSKEGFKDVSQYYNQKQQLPTKKILQFLNFKYRRLNGFIESILNTN